jgi:hypothetical protein
VGLTKYKPSDRLPEQNKTSINFDCQILSKPSNAKKEQKNVSALK